MPEQDNLGVSIKEEKPNEAIEYLADNKTMIIAKLTDELPISPDINTEVSSMKDLFEQYKPSVDLSFKDKNDVPVDEKITMENLGDFGKSGIVRKSKFLQQLEQEKKDYQSLHNIIKSNKILEKVIANPESKEAYLAVLKDLINEIENSGSK